jgi:hypothetical protein
LLWKELGYKVFLLARGAEKEEEKCPRGWVLFLEISGSEKHTFVFFAPWPP